MSAPDANSVQVRAPARLHMGFLDLNGGLGRRFGSLGMGLEEIATDLTVTPAAELSAEGPCSERALDCARRLLDHLQLKSGARIRIARAIPEHSGLGAGTQMALAVGTAVSRLHGQSLSPEELAMILGRGNRSGIGIGTFRHGGFIVDGGRGTHSGAPPVISRVPVPETWRVVLVLDAAASGLSGAVELEAFDRLGPMDENVAASLCRIVLMQILPALREGDCAVFGDGISRIQRMVGEYFSPVQRGQYGSDSVADAVSFLRRHGASGTGQSSWGPAGFALFANETEAFQAMKMARARRYDSDSLEFVLCRARNEPAPVRSQDSLVKGARRL